MNKILIDTCVWLDLAKSKSGEKLISILNQFLYAGNVKLITPTIVGEEFERNKDRIQSSLKKSYSSNLKKTIELVHNHSLDESKVNIISFLDDFKYQIASITDEAIQSVSKIDELLDEAEDIPITDSIKLNAVNRAINKLAPFHRSKNSTADAIIIESFKEYHVRDHLDNCNYLFVTHNKNDFSQLNVNEKEYHQDFNDIFNRDNIYYFINIQDALEFINPEFFEDFEMEYEFTIEPRSISEITEAELELMDKIWYNRHCYRALLVKEGKIRIIEDSEITNFYSHDTIANKFWRGALNSAKLMEEKYGIDNLTFDEYEWGYICGKLSALRWVVGNDWDNLNG